MLCDRCRSEPVAARQGEPGSPGGDTPGATLRGSIGSAKPFPYLVPYAARRHVVRPPRQRSSLTDATTTPSHPVTDATSAAQQCAPVRIAATTPAAAERARQLGYRVEWMGAGNGFAVERPGGAAWTDDGVDWFLRMASVAHAMRAGRVRRWARRRRNVRRVSRKAWAPDDPPRPRRTTDDLGPISLAPHSIARQVTGRRRGGALPGRCRRASPSARGLDGSDAPGVGALDDPATCTEAGLALERLRLLAAGADVTREAELGRERAHLVVVVAAVETKPCGRACRGRALDDDRGKCRRVGKSLTRSRSPTRCRAGCPWPSVRSDRFAPFLLCQWDWGRFARHRAAPCRARHRARATPTRSRPCRRRRADRGAIAQGRLLSSHSRKRR